MSDENVELLRRAWAAYDVGDVERFAACLIDDWRAYGPSGPSDEFVSLPSPPAGEDETASSQPGW